jgi:hypothetical protein
MAGERAGRLYEALIAAALQCDNSYASMSISCNVESPQLMVRPDILVGDPSSPSLIVLVTRAGSRRNWHQKFWRNVGEAVNVKTVFPRTRLVSINLGTEPKEELVTALAAVVDRVIFPPREQRARLEQWMASIEAGARGDAALLTQYVAAALKAADSDIRRIVRAISNETFSALAAHSDTWATVVPSLANRTEVAGAAASGWEKPPSLRRGLAKLYVFGSPDRILAALGPRGSVSDELGAAMSEFGWASKSIGGWRVSDPELSEVLAHFSRETLLEVLQHCRTPELSMMCADVASPPWLIATSEFLRKNRSALQKAEYLFDLLVSTRDDISKLKLGVAKPADLVGSWLFRSISILLKAASGRKQGFGYEQFIADIRGLSAKDRDLRLVFEQGANFAAVRRAGSTDSLRRKLVDWVSGLAGEVALPKWQIALVAVMLSKRLTAVSPTAYSKACSGFAAMARRLTYEDRIAPYAYFEPLPGLLQGALKKAGLKAQVVARQATLFSELSNANREIATCPVIIVGRTYIHWKSSHGAHTSDKTKELCGRGFAIRHRIDKNQNIVPFEEVEQTLLVLDGDFSSSDVDYLIRAGWDKVVSSRQLADVATLI